MRQLRFDEPTLLAGLILVLFAGAAVALVRGELMIAGGIFFATTFVIYLREVRS